MIKNKANKKTVKDAFKAPQSVQDSIPYIAVYENGIIETSAGVFSKSYKIGDTNFLISSDSEQERIFEGYSKFLNMFPPETNFQITTISGRVDETESLNKFKMPHKMDGLDTYRDEMNEILLKNLCEGKNNLDKNKYLTVSIACEDIFVAHNTFVQLDSEISAALKSISDLPAEPMSIQERMNVLYNIYNLDCPVSFNARATFGGKESQFFNLGMLDKYGMTTKDFIGPPSLEFKKDYIVLGDKYARVLFVESFPSALSTDYIAAVSDMPFNMITSINYESLHQDKFIKTLNDRRVFINADITEKQKRASRKGYSGGVISPSLLKAQEELNALIEDITSSNQKLFYTTVTFVVFADDLDELNKNTESIVTASGKYLMSVKKLNYQQEPGFNSSLPLGINKLFVQRFLTTETAALFLPFTTQELMHNGGFYYGMNPLSKNLIMYNRSAGLNANGMILGQSGSGKSFFAKRELFNILLNTNDDVFVIDPEREYAAMADALNGEVVKISAGSPSHINPFDMDIKYADDDNPISLKAEYIFSLIETMMKSRIGLTSVQTAIIDRCVTTLYRDYLQYIDSQNAIGNKITIDVAHTPTMEDFYNLLIRQPEAEAKNLALGLHLYAKGSLNTFAHHTNVNVDNRFVVYDIKDVGSGLKELGLQVCLNDIWNKTIANRRNNKRTWIVIDEFHILLQSGASSQFVQQMFKRARKWYGAVLGITQNIEDLLQSTEARTMLQNCDFIAMLRQAPLDAVDLADMFNMSETQLQHITSVGVGEGLLKAGSVLIPFVDKYPTNTKSYKIMTTKQED